MGGDELLDLGNSLFKRWLRDISHEDVGALLGKENRGLEADAAADTILVSNLSGAAWKEIDAKGSSPSGTGDDGVLAGQTACRLSEGCHDLTCMCLD